MRLFSAYASIQTVQAKIVYWPQRLWYCRHSQNQTIFLHSYL